ncbi:MAG: hypothetical protein LBD07_02455 [Spirochaetaceae bacterium]|jgi:hypothetical protein|nr:hypothetical protein [Spirochaetaceae bacterium]
MKNDKHTAVIPEAVITEAHSQLSAVLQKLSNHTVTLTAHERQMMLKMGDKSLAFVEKAHSYAHDNPGLVPNYLDIDAFDVDFADARGLLNLLALVRQIEEILEDTVTSAGSDAYHAALAFYHNVQAAVKEDSPGAKAILDDLKVRFASNKRRSGASG